jgi:hypothetical protein|tara:strand:+ start:1538 stop:1948 length:411 start_codon:yes stop_codon:yes gene_type:complete
MPKIQFRSKFEESVAKELRLLKQRIRYEKMSIKYAVQMFRIYKPDFVLNNGIIIEAKGWFRPRDRVKHLLIQEQYPDLDIRFLFQNAYNFINKGSSTRYCDWCDKYGFKWTDKEIPKKWLTEKKKRIQLGTLNKWK